MKYFHCKQENIPVGYVPPAFPPYIASHQMSAPDGEALYSEVLKWTNLNNYLVLATRCH